MSGQTGALEVRFIDGTFSPARAPPRLGWDCVLKRGAEPGSDPAEPVERVGYNGATSGGGVVRHGGPFVPGVMSAGYT